MLFKCIEINKFASYRLLLSYEFCHLLGNVPAVKPVVFLSQFRYLLAKLSGQPMLLLQSFFQSSENWDIYLYIRANNLNQIDLPSLFKKNIFLCYDISIFTCEPTTTICGKWMESAPTVLNTSCSLFITGINDSIFHLAAKYFFWKILLKQPKKSQSILVSWLKLK